MSPAFVAYALRTLDAILARLKARTASLVSVRGLVFALPSEG